MKHRNLCYGDGSFSPEPFTTAVHTILTRHRGSRRATFTGASSRKHHQNHHHRVNIAEHDAPRCTLKQRGLSLLAVPPPPPELPAQEEGEGLTSQPGPSPNVRPQLLHGSSPPRGVSSPRHQIAPLQAVDHRTHFPTKPHTYR